MGDFVRKIQNFFGKYRNMTEGDPVKLLIFFAVPMMVGNIVQQFYNLADSIFVGKLIGADALAATGATGPISFLFFALCNGIGSGGGIVVSQFFGANEKDKVKSCIANTAYIMLAFPLVVGTAAFFLAGPLLRLLATPEDLMSDALVYLRIMCVGLVFVSLYNYVSSMLRALGDSVSPLIFLIFSSLLNIALDYIFIKYLHMGIAGAGIATLISQFVSGILSLMFAVHFNAYFKLKRKDFRINGDIIYRSVRLGIPLSIQFSLIAISCMALQRVVNTFGPVAMAAFTATSRIEQIVHMPYQTLSTSLSTYCGQNFGAKKLKRILVGYKKSMMMMAIFTLAMLPIMQFFGGAITSIFVPATESEVITMGARALQITSWFYIFLGIIYVVRGVLNGVGDALFALINGVVEVLGRVFVPVVMTSVFALDVWGVWWSVGVVWFLSGATAWLRYLKFRKIFKQEEKVNS